MRNKRYNASMKDKYDGPGKIFAEEIMRDIVGATLITNNEKEDSGDFSDGFWDQNYELRNGETCIIEPEIKVDKGGYWGEQHAVYGRPFKYDTVDIPYRKEKCIADFHMVISDNGKYAFIVSRKAMDRALVESGGQPKIKRTEYEPLGAPYFSTPVEKGRFVVKEDGRWRIWKTKES